MLFSAGGEVRDQSTAVARFAVIRYNTKDKQFVFFATQWHNTVTSYICQLRQGLTNTVVVYRMLSRVVVFCRLCLIHI